MSDTLDDISKKDRRFRIAQMVFMVIVIAALLGLFGFMAIMLQRANEQLALNNVLIEQQKKGVDELKKDNAEKLDRQAAYIRCIANLFIASQDGRVSVDDLDTCAVTVQDEPSPIAVSPPRDSDVDVTSNQPQQRSENHNTQPEPQKPQQPQNPQPPTGNPQEQKPVDLLGIPLCVLGLCVSR